MKFFSRFICRSIRRGEKQQKERRRINPLLLELAYGSGKLLLSFLHRRSNEHSLSAGFHYHIDIDSQVRLKPPVVPAFAQTWPYQSLLARNAAAVFLGRKVRLLECLSQAGPLWPFY